VQRLIRSTILVAALLALVVAVAGEAWAQTARDESVSRRKRPDFEPLGLDLDRLLVGPPTVSGRGGRGAGAAIGSFLVFPRIEFETIWDDNIFRTRQDPRHDWIFRLKPSVGITSDWDRHALSFSASAKVDRYARTGRENNEEYRADLSGVVDVTEDLRWLNKAGYARLVEPRGNINDPGPGLRPTKLNAYTAQTGLEYNGYPIFLRPTLDFRRLDYVNNGPVNNNDRDLNQYGARFRIGYQITTDSILFVEPGYNWRVYDHKIDDAGFRRDSQGYQILGGITWNVSDVTLVEVAIGYLSQEYEDKRLPRVSGVTAQGEIVWNASELVTLTGLVRRSVEETDIPGISGVLATLFEAGVEYEFADNLFAVGRVAWGHYDFGGSNRSDYIWQFGVGANYFLTRNFFGGINYDYTVRDSNQSGFDFRNNRVTLRIGAQL